MSRKLIFKVWITWFLFIPLAIINGLVRNSLYQPWTGELLAHQISTLTGSLAFLGLVYALLRKDFSNLPNITLLKIGLGWAVMTIIFEFGFGHFVVGHSWQKLLQDYNLLAGRVWSLFLLSCVVTPWVVGKNKLINKSRN